MKENSDLQLSIIIPVYQVEKYVRPCLESVFNQGLDDEDFEVIIVNDGTKDRSMEVIQDIIDQHKNITVINQENQGLSMARNNGMAIARGEYILIPDSDDVLVENSVKPLLEKALETKADMVVADFLEMNDEEIGLRQVVQEKTNSFQIKTGKQLYLEYFNPDECYVWRTLYKKAFLRSNHLSFYPGIYFEDIPFTNECYLTANLCIKANHLMYVYRKEHLTISSVKSFDLKKAHDLCIALKKTWELRKKEGLSPEIIKKLNYMCFCTFCIIRERSLYVFESYSQKVAVIKMLKREVPDLCFTHSFKQKLDYLFYRTSSHLYIIWRMLIKRLIWHHSPKADGLRCKITKKQDELFVYSFFCVSLQKKDKMDKIDFVVPWVDSTDPEWIESYNYYRPDKPLQDEGRYRNWDIFKYWFRAVEKYAPWVNKVFLITNGKFPDWINTDCEKLTLIKHSDYIPEKFLPTFNSRTIELFLGRIENLSEHFVYFNDDMFLNAPVKPKYFFKQGLPCDYNRETILRYPRYTKQDHFSESLVFYYCTAIVNNHFSRKETVRQAWRKWYGPHLWGSPLITSILLLRQRHFEGFHLLHNEQPMLKSVFNEIWEKEKECIEKSCSRFRTDISLNQYLIRYWQFASNKFYPAKKQTVAYYNYNKKIVDDVIRNLKEEEVKTICINDSPYCSKEDYEFAAKAIRQAFEEKLPTKSMFEKS